MGITYEELKKLKGNSIVLERHENIQIEQTSNNYIRKKHTIIREIFPREESTKRINEESKKKAAKSKNSRENYTKGSKGESKTITNALIQSLILEREEHKKFEQKLNVTTQHLNHLEKVIQHEIKDLKKEHSLLKMGMSLKTKNSKNSGDMSWAENLKANDVKATKEEAEVTVEKYSQQHQGVSISPRYTNNEDVAVRPKKRTIASQMGTPKIADDRGAFGDYSSDINLKQGYDKGITAKINDPVPNKPTPTDLIVNCCHGMHYGVDPNAVCQRYNMVHNCNGIVCNQRKYQEFGVTPQREYNYCRDEYFYNYPNTTTVNCNNNRPTNVGRHCTDLNTEHFYCQTQDKSTSPKSRSASNSKRNDIKKYETTAKAKPSKEQKEKLEKEKKSNETCKEYALSRQGESEEKKEMTKERTNSKKHNKSKDKKVKSNSMIFEEEHRNLLHKKLQNESPSTLEHLDRYADVGTVFKNSKYFENQRLDGSSASTATTFKIKTKKNVCHKTFKKSSDVHQDTPNYSLDSAESKQESQYSLTTLSMLKKIKIREYKAVQPSHTVREKLKRSLTNNKAKETLMEKNYKNKKYKEYINIYRKEVGEDSKEETKNLREQLQNCRNELQTLVNQLQTAKQQNLTNQTQLTLSETLENLPATSKDQPQIYRNAPLTQIRLLEENQPQTAGDQLQIYRNGPPTSEAEQQYLNDQTQTSKGTKDQPETQFSTPYTFNKLREQTQILSYDPETSIDQFPTSSNKLPILKEQPHILRDQLYTLKLQSQNSIDQAQLLMQQTFRKSRATTEQISTCRDPRQNNGDESQTLTYLSRTVRDQPLSCINQTQIYKDQHLTSRDQRNEQDVEVSDSYVEERYEYGPAGWDNYDENTKRISEFGGQKQESGKDGYRNKKNPVRARDYDNSSKAVANHKEYQHGVEHYDYKSKFDSTGIEVPKNADNRDYNWRIQREDQKEDQRYNDTRPREPRHDKDRNVDSSGQKEYNFKSDRDNLNGSRSKASASLKEYQNKVERYQYRKNSGEIRRSLDTINIDYNSRRQREYPTEDKGYYGHKDYMHADSAEQTEYRSECNRNYNKAIELRHKHEHRPRDRNNTDYSQTTVVLLNGSRYHKNRGDDGTNEVDLYQYKSKSVEVGGPPNTCNRYYNSRRQREYQTEDERFYGTRAGEPRHEKQRSVNLERQRLYTSEGERDHDESKQPRNKYDSEYKDLNHRNYKQTTDVPRDGAKYHEERDYDEIRYRYEYLESYQDYDTTDTEFSIVKENKYKEDKYFVEPRSHSEDYKDYGRSDYNEWPRKCKDHEQQMVKLNTNKNYNATNSQKSNKDKKYKLTPPQGSSDTCEHDFLLQKPSSFRKYVKEVKQKQIADQEEEKRNRSKLLKAEISKYEEKRAVMPEYKTNHIKLKEQSRKIRNKTLEYQKFSLVHQTSLESLKGEYEEPEESELKSNSSYYEFKQAMDLNLDFETHASNQNKELLTDKESSRTFTKIEDSPKEERRKEGDEVENFKNNSSSLTSLAAYFKHKQKLATKYTEKQHGSEITNLVDITTDETFGQKTTNTEDDLRYLKQVAEQTSTETFTKSQDAPKIEQHSENKLNLPTLKSVSYNNNQKLEEKYTQKQGGSKITNLIEEITTDETFGRIQKTTSSEEDFGFLKQVTEQDSSEIFIKSQDSAKVEQHLEEKLNLPTLKSASYNNNLKLKVKNTQKEGSSMVTQLKEEISTDETFGPPQKPSNTDIMNLLTSNEKFDFEGECSEITNDLINKLSSCTTTTKQIITSKTHLEKDTFAQDTHTEHQPLKYKWKDFFAENGTDELQYTPVLNSSNVNQQEIKQQMKNQSITSKTKLEEAKYSKDKASISKEHQSLEYKSADTLDEKTLAETQISDQQTVLKANQIEMEQCTKSIGETSVKTYCTPINKDTDYKEETSTDICKSTQSEKKSMPNDRNFLEIGKRFSQSGSNANGTKKKEIVPQKSINDRKLETLSNLEEEKQALKNVLNTSNYDAAPNDYYCYEAEQEFYYQQNQTESQYLETEEDYKRHLEYQDKVSCFSPPDEYINPQQSPFTVEYSTYQDSKQSQYNPNQCYEGEFFSPKAPCITYESECYCSPAASETNYVPLPSPSRVSQIAGTITEYNETSSQFTKESTCDASSLLPLKSILKPCCANKVTAETLYELETYRTTSSVMSLEQEERINTERGSVRTYILGQEKITQNSDENIDTVITKDECLRPVRKQEKRVACVKQPIYKNFNQIVYEEQHTCTKTNAGSKYSESIDRYSAQNIPSSTNCPCMMNTYLDMLEIFYKSKN